MASWVCTFLQILPPEAPEDEALAEDEAKDVPLPRNGAGAPQDQPFVEAGAIRVRISFAAAGMFVPGPKMAFTPAFFRKS